MTNITPQAFIVVSFAFLGAWRVGVALRGWWRSIPLSPDPWDAGITEQMEDPASLPVCHHCFTPQAHDRWFCPECGNAVGSCNNVMAYINIFSFGEVARNAVYGHLRPGPVTVIGYLVFGLTEYLIFAPVFWYLFWVNLQRWKRAPLEPDEDV